MKKQAVCSLSVIPLRSEPSHRSEQVSQLLFGEYFSVLEEREDWIMIKCADPAYEGWIQRGQYATIAESSNDFSIVDVCDALVQIGDHKPFPLLHGCVLPSAEQLVLDEAACRIEGSLRKPSLLDFADEFPKLIDYYIGAPYLWGGRSRFGVDCSGLVQLIYRHFAISLYRDASQQASQGDTVDFLQEVRSGDLAFFDNEEGHITHVGILIDKETILHASSSVRIDRIDTTGIYHSELKTYTHRLRIIKRMLTDELLKPEDPVK